MHMEAKGGKITVEVQAKMTVDESTANGCLALVEMYINQTGKRVVSTKRDDGTEELRYEFA